MLKLFCDRCGKEIASVDNETKIEYLPNIIVNNFCEEEKKTYYLCPQCKYVLKKFLDGKNDIHD